VSLLFQSDAGNGNVHVNLLGAEAVSAEVEARVLQLAARLGGTISAEHGVGLAKRRYLSLCRSPAEIAAMAAIKAALDPAGILGAGRVL